MTTLEIETVAAAEALTADEFYAELTRRNRGLISAAQQQALEEGTVLVAGCGSVGGAAVQPLARLGVRRFLVADSGAYDLNNLNRQHAGVADIGRNKAEVAAERILSVNPHAELRVFPEGVTTQNLAELSPNLGNTSYSVPQLVQAALMFGAMSSHMVAKLLAGEHVPAEVSLDVHQAVRRPAARLASVAGWPGEAVRMIRALKRYQQEI